MEDWESAEGLKVESMEARVLWYGVACGGPLDGRWWEFGTDAEGVKAVVRRELEIGVGRVVATDVGVGRTVVEYEASGHYTLDVGGYPVRVVLYRERGSDAEPGRDVLDDVASFAAARLAMDEGLRRELGG